MYDKVKLWIPRTRDMPDIGSFLDEAKEQTNLKTREFDISTSLLNMSMSQPEHVLQHKEARKYR